MRGVRGMTMMRMIGALVGRKMMRKKSTGMMRMVKKEKMVTTTLVMMVLLVLVMPRVEILTMMNLSETAAAMGMTMAWGVLLAVGV